MQFRNRSVLASLAFVAVGAVTGAWITAKTGQFPFSFDHVPAAAQSAIPEVSLKTGFGPIVKRVQPAVVSVISTTNAQKTSQRALPNLPPGFEDFFGGLPFDIPQGPSKGLGSGVIMSADGYIVTNNHVVDSADQVRVQLQDNREFTAKVVGKDGPSDLAVLKIDASGLPYLSFGNSDSTEVGDVVLAMGNPFGVGQTVTMGIVGATHRNTPAGQQRIEEYEDFIQTDAAINPGNSGGALVNLKGELIGINVAIVSRSGGNQGVGFAIPAKTARYVTDQIRDHGKVSRGFMGILPQDVSADIAKHFGLTGGSRGALIGDVTSGSAADRAGLKEGDIILELNGSRIADAADLRMKIAALTPGATANLKVFRNRAEQSFTVTLGSQAGQDTVSRNDSSADDNTPRLGISVEPSRSRLGKNARAGGVTITRVEPGSAADEAGLRQGDVILRVNGSDVSDPAEFQKLVRLAGKQDMLLWVESTSDRDQQSLRHFLTVQPR
jgi:serine protease Do